ncbi:mpv17-like protein isoform X2 [Cimex lectularius]|uniref:Mpv17-like protein n=1 Tax=Cimex lectularius TaxID=79782 RepID=A0A8I6TEB0_CIMLE|nr:mpv17-like protein isoform X2 [Cimex lectularius]
MAMSRVKYIFQKYPLLANSAVYGGMCVTAEFSQQMVNKRYFDRKEPPEPIDKAMLVRYAVVGSCINSNILYFWFIWLERKVPGKSLKSIAVKLLLHQFLMTPPFLAAFYLSMSIMEGKDDLLAELREKFVPTFQTSCGFWLPAQAINFLVVPPMARVVYVATCSFIWVNILCWIKRTELKSNPS